MHLVQILLPLHDNAREAFPSEEYSRVRHELTERFGGLTVYHPARAEGHWKPGEKNSSRDEIAVFEVMTNELETNWWSEYRRELEKRFRQEVVVVRAHETQLL